MTGLHMRQAMCSLATAQQHVHARAAFNLSKATAHWAVNGCKGFGSHDMLDAYTSHACSFESMGRQTCAGDSEMSEPPI